MENNYSFNSNKLRTDYASGNRAYKFNSNILRTDLLKIPQEGIGRLFENEIGFGTDPIEVIEKGPRRKAWETWGEFETVFEGIPTRQVNILKEKLAQGENFNPISPKNKKAMNKMYGKRTWLRARNPFYELAEQSTANILRGVNQGLLPEPPTDRYVKLKSGPFKGKWKKIHEQVPIWSEVLYKFVISSMMEAIAYNPETRELEIEFKGGAVYRYRNVTKTMWNNLNRAGSKGKWFWKYMRRFVRRFPYKRVRFLRKETEKLPKSLREKGYKT